HRGHNRPAGIEHESLEQRRQIEPACQDRQARQGECDAEGDCNGPERQKQGNGGALEKGALLLLTVRQVQRPHERRDPERRAPQRDERSPATPRPSRERSDWARPRINAVKRSVASGCSCSCAKPSCSDTWGTSKTIR